MSVIIPLNIEKYINELKLQEVISPILVLSNGSFHPEGLLSENIFGANFSITRKKQLAYINMNTTIVHPLLFRILKRLDIKLIKLILLESDFYFDDKNKTILTSIEVKGKENEYTKISGFKGFEYCMNNNISMRGGTTDRDKLIDKILEYKNNGKLYFDKLLVIPPSIRPVLLNRENGSLESVDDINLVYISIIQLSNKLKTISQESSLQNIIKKDLQIKINELYQIGQLKVGKKTGLARSSNLGKRVDFSARSVIIGDPNLKVGETGLPLRIAVTLFEPYIINMILTKLTDNQQEMIRNWLVPKYGTDFNIMTIKKFLFSMSKDYIKDTKIKEFFIKLIQEIVDSNQKVVIVKRDPTLHRLSMQAYKPIIYDGHAIKMQQLQTSGHNADYDGDSFFGIIRRVFRVLNGEIIDLKTEHISNLEYSKYLEEYQNYQTESGKIITKYKIKDGIVLELMTINPETGEEQIQQVTEFSKHENLEMYRIHDTKNRFTDFHVSTDHSLIIYDESDDRIKKISPIELVKNPKGKYLIKGNQL